MSAFVRSFRWVMLVAGLLTSTMFYAAVSPADSLQSMFGQSIDGPAAEIVVRSWGVLIGLIGLMLIYGAFNEGQRRMALLVAAASKAAFIVLVLSLGRQFLEFQVGTAIVVDSIMVVVFVTYLVVTGRRAAM